ncbi:hypothetical protein EG328_009837 [Venturia inaequalis]|uniref:MADS-box domain-containing protein n=1 Tax=Venturia inaequalis TaxID=5025 RepID=A0A8H3U7T3_VENIN|nr:hypothetical protein EG328_009837 [Venturia inaequalis]
MAPYENEKKLGERTKTLLRKAFQLHDDFDGIEVYVAIKSANNKYTTYSSSRDVWSSINIGPIQTAHEPLDFITAREAEERTKRRRITKNQQVSKQAHQRHQQNASYYNPYPALAPGIDKLSVPSQKLNFLPNAFGFEDGLIPVDSEISIMNPLRMFPSQVAFNHLTQLPGTAAFPQHLVELPAVCPVIVQEYNTCNLPGSGFVAELEALSDASSQSDRDSACPSPRMKLEDSNEDVPAKSSATTWTSINNSKKRPFSLEEDGLAVTELDDWSKYMSSSEL